MDDDKPRDESNRDLLQRLVSHRPVESRYEMLDSIAAGGMGEVLKAYDSDLRRTLALKRIKVGGDAAPSDEMVDRFFEEAQVTAQLSHPGVVPVHELGVDPEGQVFFTMARVVGRDLEQIFEELRGGESEWTVTRLLRVLSQVCETMAFAHSMKVIHRDLKPANVMVGNFGEVYVMDWGIAKVLGSEGERAGEKILTDRSTKIELAASVGDGESGATLEGTLLGTPAYMSPEQAQGAIEDLDRRSDVYALGAMLYTLVVGNAPYGEKARNSVEIVLALRSGPPKSIESLARGVSPELVAICEKAMARDPEERYVDTGEMAVDLRAYLEGRVVRAHRTGAWIEFKKWVARNKALASAMGVAILATIAGLGGVSLSESNRREQVETKMQELLRLSDVKEIRELENEAAELWPAYPKMLGPYGRWLRRAREVLGRREAHAAAEARISASMRDAPDLRTMDDLDSRQLLQNVAWQLEALTGLLERIEVLPDLIDDLEWRVGFAETIAERSIEGPEASRLWKKALAEFDSLEVYADLELTPQMGLLPIGKDPESGLLEFAHLQSGELPERSPGGTLYLDEESAIVLVLLPGGAFQFGSRSATQAEYARFDTGETNAQGRKKTVLVDLPNVDWASKDDEGPVRELILDPFFAGKHEVTQAQWRRITGSTPAQRRELLTRPDENPVQNVSGVECKYFALSTGLELPTEAQWEYAARGGSGSVFHTGTSPRTLEGHANISDSTARDSGRTVFNDMHSVYLEDGFVFSSPIGTFDPNGFGLHDVHGNVWEWCRDNYSGSREFRAGDGLRTPQPHIVTGTIRGGSWLTHEKTVRIANRFNYEWTGQEGDLGMRAIRVIDR